MFLREKVSVTFSISSVIQQADDLLASIKGWSQSEDPTTGEAILQKANDLLSILERGKVTASSDTHVDEVLSEVAKAQDATAAEEAVSVYSVLRSSSLILFWSNRYWLLGESIQIKGFLNN